MPCSGGTGRAWGRTERGVGGHAPMRMQLEERGGQLLERKKIILLFFLCLKSFFYILFLPVLRWACR